MSKSTTNQQRRNEALIAEVLTRLQGEGFDPDEVIIARNQPQTIESLVRWMAVTSAIGGHFDHVLHQVNEAARQVALDGFTLSYEQGGADGN